MREVLLTLALLATASSAARADEGLAERVGAARERAEDAVTEATERSRERAGELARAAGERIDAAGRAASSEAAEAHEAAREKAREASGFGEDLGERVGEAAREKWNTLGSYANALLARTKEAATDAVASARGGARDLLRSAADALDAQNAEAVRTRRAERWAEIRTRFRLHGARPSRALSEELRVHEHRVARLERARELAAAAEDEQAVTRIARLLRSERARHRQRVLKLRAQGSATDAEDGR